MSEKKPLNQDDFRKLLMTPRDPSEPPKAKYELPKKYFVPGSQTPRITENPLIKNKFKTPQPLQRTIKGSSGKVYEDRAYSRRVAGEKDKEYYENLLKSMKEETDITEEDESEDEEPQTTLDDENANEIEIEEEVDVPPKHPLAISIKQLLEEKPIINNTDWIQRTTYLIALNEANEEVPLTLTSSKSVSLFVRNEIEELIVEKIITLFKPQKKQIKQVEKVELEAADVEDDDIFGDVGDDYQVQKSTKVKQVEVVESYIDKEYNLPKSTFKPSSKFVPEDADLIDIDDEDTNLYETQLATEVVESDDDQIVTSYLLDRKVEEIVDPVGKKKKKLDDDVEVVETSKKNKKKKGEDVETINKIMKEKFN